VLGGIGAGPQRRIEARAALRQSVGVAVAPEALPGATSRLGSLVARPDGLDRKLSHLTLLRQLTARMPAPGVERRVHGRASFDHCERTIFLFGEAVKGR